MSAPPSQTTVLITGANRGIGRSLTTTYLLRPSHTIIALARDPQNETSASLLSEPRGENTTIILLKYDASLPTSAESALTALKSQHPKITRLDTVIANAGFSSHFGPSLDADVETYLRHYTVNTLGPLLLFRAVLPLLMASTTNPKSSTDSSTPPSLHKPRFIAISSGTGSITRVLSLPPSTSNPPVRTGALPYTSSKCALNHVMAKLSREYPEIAVGLFTPGPTKTGFGGGGVNWDGIKGVQGVEEVVAGLLGLFDKVGEEGKEEGDGGKFALRDWRGVELEW